MIHVQMNVYLPALENAGSSADFGFAKVKLNSLTHYLYLSMLLSVGRMEFGSDPADTYEIFRKLNESYMQHIRLNESYMQGAI